MILLITFCVTFIIQIYFFAFLFRKYAFYSPVNSAAKVDSVSIVICAKNEADKLKKLLDKLKAQRFPNIEIVLVNDNSEDQTLQVMQRFKEARHEADFDVIIEDISSGDSDGKKKALTRGILLSRHEHLLLTDADCLPLSNTWIEEMTSQFQEKTRIVLGYGAYDKIKGSFLNKIQRFETLITALQYFSYALNDRAYMGVGRNLSYRKSVFLEANGFENHQHIKSGDDDLFVSQIARPNTVRICDDPNGFTSSIPEKNLRSWIRQKRRHISTAGQYSFYHKSMLGIYYLSQLSFYVLALIGLVTNTYLQVIIPLFLIRFIIWYWTIAKTAIRLNEKDLIAFGPLYEISIIFMQLYIFLKNIISPPKYW